MNNEELAYFGLSTYDSIGEYELLVARDESDALYGGMIAEVLGDDPFADDMPDWQVDLIAEQEGW